MASFLLDSIDEVFEVTSEANGEDKHRTEKSHHQPSVSMQRKLSPEKSKPKTKIIIGRKRTALSSSANSNVGPSGGTVKRFVAPSAATATPHRGPRRFLNVNSAVGGQDARSAVQAKSAAIMKNLLKGVKTASPDIDFDAKKNKENQLPAKVKIVEKPPDMGGLAMTPRRAIIASLDDFSPSPVVRREPQEGIRNLSPDIDAQEDELGTESESVVMRALLPDVVAPFVRTSTAAAVPAFAPSVDTGPSARNPTGVRQPESHPPVRQPLQDDPIVSIIPRKEKETGNEKKTAPLTKKTEVKKKGSSKIPVPPDFPKTKGIINRPVRGRPQDAVDVVEDNSIVEEETPPTFQKTPARFVNKDKRGIKRNKLKERLEAHEEKEDEEQEDIEANTDNEEPPKKKASPENTFSNEPCRSLVTRPSDVDEWFGPLPPRALIPPDGSVRARLATEEAAVGTVRNKVNKSPKNSSSDANFKKPLLPQPSKRGPRKNKETKSSQPASLGEKRKPEVVTEEGPTKGTEVKASDTAKVGEKRKPEVTTEQLRYTEEIRYLNNWLPLLRNKRLYIEGDLLNFDSVAPGDMSSKWITSKIVSRFSERKVGTKKTCYVLEGQLSIPAPEERPMPLFVIDKFKNGFPENWKNILHHWIQIIDQNIITAAKNQNILSSIQSMTMAMFNSTPMPGMLSNINMCNMSSITNASRAVSRTPVKIVQRNASKSRSPVKPGLEADPITRDNASKSRSPAKPIARANASKSRNIEKRILESGQIARTIASKSRSPTKQILDIDQRRIDENRSPSPNQPTTEDHRSPRPNHKTSKSVKAASKSKGGDQEVSEYSPVERWTTKTAERQSRSKTVRQTVNHSKVNNSSNQSATHKTHLVKSGTLKVIDGAKHFYCDFCNYEGVGERWNLTRHIRNEHPDEDLRTSPRSLSNDTSNRSKNQKQEMTSKRSLSESSVAEVGKQNQKTPSDANKSSADFSGPNQHPRSKRGETRSKSANKTLDKSRGPEKNGPGPKFVRARPARGRSPSGSPKRKSFEKSPSSFINTVDSIKIKTMSLHDFSQLKLAKSYQHTTMVKKKKFYLCQLCDFQCSVFAALKDHLKNLHVDCENNESPNVSSPSPAKTKPQSKSPTKRKVRSKNKTPPQKGYGKLVQAVQGQDEKSEKKSRFGRKLVKNNTFNRTSWVDVTPSPDIHELEMSNCKKIESARKGRSGRPTRLITSKSERWEQLQRNSLTKKVNLTNKSKKAMEDQGDVETRQPAKNIKMVPNPFRVDGAGDSLTEIPTKIKKPLRNIKANPKTVKDRVRNAAILKDFNDEHEDDMFGNSTKVGPKGDGGRIGKLGNLGNLDDDSDSENDISLHSNRTPIAKYLGVRNDTTTPSLGMEKTPSEGSDTQQPTGFQSEAFIHKKVVDKKKEAREKTKRRLKTTLTMPPSAASRTLSEVEQSTRIIDNMTIEQNNMEDEEEIEDEYFDFESEQFSCDNPAVLLLFRKEQEELKTKEQEKSSILKPSKS